MTDFSKILDKAKEIENKMKESQEKIKSIRAEGFSGSNSVKVILDGDGEMYRIEISNEILKEEKGIIEDLILAAHNNAKSQLKIKTTKELRHIFKLEIYLIKRMRRSSFLMAGHFQQVQTLKLLIIQFMIFG